MTFHFNWWFVSWYATGIFFGWLITHLIYRAKLKRVRESIEFVVSALSETVVKYSVVSLVNDRLFKLIDELLNKGK